VHLGLDVLGGLLLGRPADLADHDHGLGVRVGLEPAETVDEARARHRVAADAHAGGLTDARHRQLVEGLVRQRAGAGDDADRTTGLGDLAGGDADVALPGGDDAGTVRADELGVGVITLQLVEHQRLVLRRDPLGDADDEPDTGRGRLADGVGRRLRRHDDEGSVRAGLVDRFLHGVVDRDALDVASALAGRHARDDLGAVVPVAEAVEPPLPAGQPLDNDLRVLVDKDAHRGVPPASSTAVRAASSMVGLEMKLSDSRSLRISLPCSALVPSRRMTIGGRMSTVSSACTMPLATSSPRVMPPQMLMKIACTFSSVLMTSRALAMTSALAPPPISRKLAGEPPT